MQLDFFSRCFFSQVDMFFLFFPIFPSRLVFLKSTFFFLSRLFLFWLFLHLCINKCLCKNCITKYKMMCVKWMKGPVYCEKWTPPRHRLWQWQDFRLLFLGDITKKARGTSGWCWEKNWCRRKSGGTNDDVFPWRVTPDSWTLVTICNASVGIEISSVRLFVCSNRLYFQFQCDISQGLLATIVQSWRSHTSHHNVVLVRR